MPDLGYDGMKKPGACRFRAKLLMLQNYTKWILSGSDF